MYSVKKCKDVLKKKGVKDVSRFNKKELNEKILDVRKNTKTKINKKYDTTASIVLKLTKNNITNHIMSYVVDMTYYDYIKNTVHSEYLHKLQLYQL